jgi:hypothetical protein
VLELIRELQSVEADLGFAQTPLEVAMDDWATGSLSDQDDKTRISSVNSIDPQADRRRRRSKPSADVTRSGTHPSVSQGLHNSLTRIQPRRRRTALAWALVAASVVVVGLAGTGVSLLARQVASAIPTVTNIEGSEQNGTVVFSWDDPGIREGDSYVVVTRGGESSIQRGTEFRVDPHGENQVCLTVTVNREGKTGATSGEKCVGTADGGGQ